MTRMVPRSSRLRDVPRSKITLKAMFRAGRAPVIAMAAAMTSDAAISATAGLVKPSRAAASAAPVPSARSGVRPIGRDTKQKGDKRHQHDGARGVVYRFRHPDHDGENENAEHVLRAGDRKIPAGCGIVMIATSAATPTSRPMSFSGDFSASAGALAVVLAGVRSSAPVAFRHSIPFVRVGPETVKRSAALHRRPPDLRAPSTKYKRLAG